MNFVSSCLWITVFVTLCGSCVHSQAINQNVLRMVSDLGDNNFDDMLRPILKKRVVNTTGHEEVKLFIISQLETMGYSVILDEFRNQTPFGPLYFTNVIGRLNPDADKFLTLACHYDSKYFADFEFVAATDSAVPCAIMLDLIRTLNPVISNGVRNNKEISLQLLFLDGEEALVDWTDYDSIYGAKHLAAKWEDTPFTDSKGRQGSEFNRIDLFVLLDLIGAAGSRYFSLYPNTMSQNRKLYDIERSLGKMGRLQSSNYQFQRRGLPGAQIADDHVPFQQRGAPILHLISVPFPNNWHKAGDNYNNLDFNSIRSFEDVLRVYVYDYLTRRRS